MASISDLPPELLVEVTTHLAAFEDISQISLARTCKRFYNIIIHSALVEQVKEIEKLSSHARISPPLYNLPNGSRIGPSSEVVLFQRDFGCNNIRFTVGAMTVKELRSLRCFVCRADKLRRVEINLLVTKPCNLKHVARLVGTCAAKSDLSLQISGGVNGPLSSPFRFDFQEGELSVPNSSPVQNSHPYYSVTKRQHEFHDDSFPKPQLCELSLDGELPFLLPLYPAISNCLTSPITTLSISGTPPSVTLFHWGQILASITLPNLREITLENLLIAFPDLLAFLERHQTIRILDLTDDNVIGVVRLPPRPFLPCLFSFTANAEYLLPFIQHKKQGYFPCLEVLHASPCGKRNSPDRNRYPIIPDELHPVYDSLSQKGHSLALSVVISSVCTAGLVQWLLSTAYKRSFQGPDSPTSTSPLACVRQVTIKDPSISASARTTEQLEEWFDDYVGSLRDKMVDEEEFMYDASKEKKIEVLLWTTCLELTVIKIGNGRELVRDYSSLKQGFIV